MILWIDDAAFTRYVICSLNSFVRAWIVLIDNMIIGSSILPARLNAGKYLQLRMEELSPLLEDVPSNIRTPMWILMHNSGTLPTTIIHNGSVEDFLLHDYPDPQIIILFIFSGE